MSEYDIVVVGGGPTGSSAARMAAERGARTIMLEEHSTIGLPEHCVGLLSPVLSQSSKQFMEELVRTVEPRAVISELKGRRMYSPSGRVKEISLAGTGTYLIDRSLFDLGLARQAGNAGAEIMLNTKVTDLIREDGFIKGVITNSRTTPEIRCKVVIAADGLRSHFAGIPKWEGMAWTDIRITSGILWHLTAVKGIEPGVIEAQFGSFNRRRWSVTHSLDSVSCTADFTSLEEFEVIKAGKWVFSKKLRDCRVLRMQGWSHPFPMGRMLPKKVKDGLILAGDAAGFQGTDVSIMSGRYAAEVATEAIKAGDVTESKLSKYDELCKKIGQRRSWHSEKFWDASEEELEKYFDEIDMEHLYIKN